MAWLAMRMVLLTVTGEPNARSMPPLTPGAPARRQPAAAAAGPAASDVVSEQTAIHEARLDRDEGDTAPFPDAAGAAGHTGAAGRPGAADSLIPDERSVGNGRGGGGHAEDAWEAEDAAAGGRTAVETVCDGTAPGAMGVPRARLFVSVELRTFKLAKLLIPPPCPEPKLFSPSPPAAPIAALPLSVQSVTVIVTPKLLELLSAPPPALAPGLPPAPGFR